MNTIKINGKEVLYKDLSIEDIIFWCKANGEVEWLKAKAHETKVRKIYPKGENGKADKKAEPVGTKEVPISYIEIKKDFAEKFAPEILPVAKPKKKTMLELIDAL